MDGVRATDIVMYRCFPIFLDEVATMWFIRLAMKSISSFDQLARMFMEQLMLNTIRLKDVMSPSSIHQGVGDTLKDFLNQFNTVT